jgi:membrane-associated HD superfamily phosphohydrolase
MSLLKLTLVFGLVFVFTAETVSPMDFSDMDFARDTMMQYSSGTERTVQILKPDFKTVKVPIIPVVPKSKKGWLSRRRRASTRRSKPRMKSTTKLVFVRQAKTYRARSSPSNTFLEALTTIERGVADAKAAQRKMRYSNQKLQAMKATIKLAVQNRLFQYARHKLGQTLFLIKAHSAKRTSRSKRSTQNKASTFINDLKQTMGSAQFDKFMAVMGDVTLMFAIDTTGSMSDEIETAKRIAVDVINYPRENPVNYILSPFSDPSKYKCVYNSSVYHTRIYGIYIR